MIDGDFKSLMPSKYQMKSIKIEHPISVIDHFNTIYGIPKSIHEKPSHTHNISSHMCMFPFQNFSYGKK